MCAWKLKRELKGFVGELDNFNEDGGSDAFLSYFSNQSAIVGEIDILFASKGHDPDAYEDLNLVFFESGGDMFMVNNHSCSCCDDWFYWDPVKISASEIEVICSNGRLARAHGEPLARFASMMLEKQFLDELPKATAKTEKRSSL